MKKILLIMLLLSLSPGISLKAAEKMRTAVIDLQGKGVSKTTASAITDIIRSDFVDSGQFIVVERGQMDQVLKEQELQATGCTDSTCAVEIGKLLSARKILIGEVSRVGKSIYITVRIVDIEKGVAEFSSREKAESLDNIDRAARKLSVRLIERITGKRGSDLMATTRTRSGYYLRSILPGWGQFYAGNTAKGFIFGGVFLLAAGFTYYSVTDFMDKESAYDDLPAGTSESVFKSKYDDSEKAGKLALVSLGTLGFIYVAHWIDIIFFSGKNISSADNRGTGSLAMPLVALTPRYYQGSGRERGADISLVFRF